MTHEEIQKLGLRKGDWIAIRYKDEQDRIYIVTCTYHSMILSSLRISSGYHETSGWPLIFLGSILTIEQIDRPNIFTRLRKKLLR